MSEQKHTPGPWSFQRSATKCRMTNTEGWTVLAINGGMIPTDRDARRIIACVNACEGLETRDLETGAIAAKAILAEHYKAQRDELLAALERAERAMSNVAAVGIPEALEIARAAIAKCKHP